MRVRIALLLILLVVVLLATSAGVQSAPRNRAETGTISGGTYRLRSFGMEADGASTGGAYRLLGPLTPSLRGSGCCCTYLPCILRSW
jgi:hypothetical protein